MDEQLLDGSDITQHFGAADDDSRLVAIGFFTPNYRPVTERFAAQLHAVGCDYHMFAISDADWRQAILMKPKIAQQARAIYPGRTLMQFDVDCQIKAPIEHVNVVADLTLSWRNRGKGKLGFVPSSRVLVWAATPGATRAQQMWAEKCKTGPQNNDEAELGRTIAALADVSYATLPEILAGREEDRAPEGAIVTHISEHKTATKTLSYKNFERTAKTYFRSAFRIRKSRGD